MNRSFFTGDEKQELFALRVNRTESMRLINEVAEECNLLDCYEHIYIAEVNIWKLLLKKLGQVKNSDEFWQLFRAACDIFGEDYFTFELKVTFETLLRKFREFISEQCARARQKLHSV